MSNELLQILSPALNAILIAILGIIGREVIKVAPKLIDLVVAKIGLTNYNKYKLIAQDIFYQVEEYYRLHPEAKDTLMSKATFFQQLIKSKIPNITDTEIEEFRQAVVGEFNKDKPAVIKELEQPVEEVPIIPIIKYVAPDGTELQPVNNIIVSETTVTQ